MICCEDLCREKLDAPARLPEALASVIPRKATDIFASGAQKVEDMEASEEEVRRHEQVSRNCMQACGTHHVGSGKVSGFHLKLLAPTQKGRIKSGNRSLVQAIFRGDLGGVSQAIEEGADPNSCLGCRNDFEPNVSQSSLSHVPRSQPQ